MMTLHFLSQYDGAFLGAAEIHGSTAELWSVDGNVDTHIHVGGLYDDDLYSVLVNQFTVDAELDESDVYITDSAQSEILYAA